MLLENLFDDKQWKPSSALWSVAVAADRWAAIKPKLQNLIDSTAKEETSDVLESLLFIVDESLYESTYAEQSGNLAEYADALQEIADVLLSEIADVSLQTLILSELQKVVLPS